MIVYLDTNIVGYTVEQYPVFGPKARTRLATERRGGQRVRDELHQGNQRPRR